MQRPRQNAGRPEVESKSAVYTPCMRVAHPVTGRRRKAAQVIPKLRLLPSCHLATAILLRSIVT